MGMNELTQSEYHPPALAAETASTAVAAQAKALVEARYVIAIRRPRDMDRVREGMLKECQRPSFAAVARYRKPIGRDQSKWPTGPSIRFAEAALRHMTNVTVESMTVFDDRERRIVRVTVTDLEANVPYSQDVSIQKTIERRSKKDGDVVLRERTNSYGDKLYILEGTDDDITNKQAALISKAVRTLGLRLVPGDLVDECMDLVIETQQRADAQDPDAARRKLFDGFGALGIRVEQLKAYLGHEGSSLTPKELQSLRELYAAIRDGEAVWRDVMDEREASVEAPESAGANAVRQAATEKRKAGKAGAGMPVAESAAGAPTPAAQGSETASPPPVAAPAQTASPPAPAAKQKPPTAAPAAQADLIVGAAGEQRPAVDDTRYAQFAHDMANAKDKEIATLVLDDAREALSPDALADLLALWNVTWGKA